MQRLNQILYYLRESPMLAAGFIMVSIIVLFGLLGPIFVDTKMAQPLSTTPRLEPSLEHLFGTDDSGRDLLAVMVVGVPLTLLSLESRHRAAVVELGMNHIGEIAWALRCRRGPNSPKA